MARQAYLYSTSLVLRWMIRLNIGVLLLLFAASPIVVPIFFNIAKAAGNTYYVDCNAADDTQNGQSQGNAWKTINKVNISSFSAGDSILFKKGCTWREQLTVPSSGSAGSPITFGAYGSGTNPIISGADVFTSFSAHTAEIYKKTGVTTEPKAVAVGGVSYFNDPLVAERGSGWTAPTGYAHFKLIRFSEYYVTPSDLTNQWVYITIDGDTDIGASALSSGYDVVFYDSAGTALTFQRVSFSITGGAATGAFWVKVPTLKTGYKYGTGIWCYYGKASATDASTTWGSPYELVMHLDETASTAANHYIDSSGNARNGTLTDANANTTGVAGVYGNAVNFGEVDDVITAGTWNMPATNKMTVEAWVYINGVTGDSIINEKSLRWRFMKTGTGVLRFVVATADVGWYGAPVDGATNLHTLSGWHHVAGTYDGAHTRLYVDGVLDGTGDLTGNINTGTDAVTVGSAGLSFLGGVDDVRVISGTALSAEQLSLDYRIGAAKLASWGTQEVTWGIQDAGLDGRWYWSANTLYIGRNAGNPSSVEAGQRDYGILSNGSTSDITIDGLEVSTANNSGIKSVTNNRWTVQNSNVHGNANINILLQGNTSGAGSITGIVVQDNTIGAVDNPTIASGFGLGVLGATSPIIARNRITPVTGIGIALWRGSTVSWGTGAASSGAQVYGNWITAANGAGIVNAYTAGSSIYDNVIANGYGSGVGIWYTSDNVILHHNVIANMGLSYNRVLWNGVDVNNNSQTGIIYNNTIYKVWGSSVTLEGVIAPAQGWLVKNNILDASVNTMSLYGMNGTVWIDSGNGVTTYTLDHNLHYGNAVSLAQIGAVYYAHISDWAAASGETNSLEGDPKFVAPASNNFTLQSSSPAIDTGTNLGSPYNMGLDPRTSFPWSTIDQGIYNLWEIGAFVYVPNLGSGNQTEPRYDFLNNSATSATSNHTLVFTVQNSLDNTGGSASDTLALTFQSNFNLSNITCGDVNVATGTRFLFNVASPEPRTNCPSTATSWGLLIDPASRTITITVPKNVQTYVATGTILTVSIGTNANYQNQGTHWIVNPSTEGTKSVTIGGTFGGYGQILVSVNTPLTLSATINETLTLTLAGLAGSGTGGMNSCSSNGTTDAEDGGAINLINTTAATVPFGTLNTANAFYEGCQKVSVTTNAGNGYTIAVREDHPLRTVGGTAIADTACDTNGCLNTPSTAAAWVTNTNSGLGISCAHSATSQSCWTANPNWINGTRWAPIASEGKNNPTGGTQTPAIFSGLSSATGVEVITKAKYRVSVGNAQSPGTYNNQVSFIATPVF